LGTSTQLRIGARAAEVQRLYPWLDAAIAALPQQLRNDMQVALEEAVMNVAFHAYAPEEPGEVQIALTLGEAEAVLVVEDAGRAFDPVAAPPGKKPESLESAQPGGLGLVLMRHHCRALEYERRDGHNRLTLRFAVTRD
jgi:anti-sigma regulatory factor (Ser/Thr protein kinase)